MTIQENFPWAKVGDKAFIYNAHTFGVTELTEVEILKVTKARVTVSGYKEGRTFYQPKHRTELNEVGRDWYHSPTLIGGDDPRIASAQEAHRKAGITTAAYKAATEFTRSRTVDNAHKAVAALLDFIQENKG